MSWSELTDQSGPTPSYERAKGTSKTQNINPDQQMQHDVVVSYTNGGNLDHHQQEPAGDLNDGRQIEGSTDQRIIYQPTSNRHHIQKSKYQFLFSTTDM
jgi:hypothetical protein